MSIIGFPRGCSYTPRVHGRLIGGIRPKMNEDLIATRGGETRIAFSASASSFPDGLPRNHTGPSANKAVESDGDKRVFFVLREHVPQPSCILLKQAARRHGSCFPCLTHTFPTAPHR